jgi:hypothetical protein
MPVAIPDTLDVTDETTATDIAGYVRRQLPKTTSLVYIHYDDALTPDQIQAHFAAADGIYTVCDEINDHFYDNADDRAREIIKDIIDDDEAQDLLESDDDEYRDLIDTVHERDDSDPRADLLRNTHAMLFRYRLSDDWENYPISRQNYNDESDTDEREAQHIASTLGIDVDRYRGDSWNAADRQVDETARKLADIAGVWYDDFRDSLTEIIVNASYGGSPEISWYGDPRELIGALKRSESGDEWDLNGTITFREPHLLLIDFYNGCGHDAKLKGAVITVPFDPSRIVVDDAKNVGYGWDSIAGVYKPAYAADVSIEYDVGQRIAA